MDALDFLDKAAASMTALTRRVLHQARDPVKHEQSSQWSGRSV